MLKIEEILQREEIRSRLSQLEVEVKQELSNWSSYEEFMSKRFLLRYILSFRNETIEQVAEAVRKALEWRHHNKSFVTHVMLSSNSIQDKPEIFPLHIRPYLKVINTLLSAGLHKCTRDGQPLVLIRINCCNFYKLMQIVPPNVLVDYVVYSNELEFWECDRRTARSGKLHKTYRIVDMNGISLSFIDSRFYKIFKDSSKMSEFLHPQLVSKTILANVPAIFSVVVDILKRMDISARALSKITINRIKSDYSSNTNIATITTGRSNSNASCNSDADNLGHGKTVEVGNTLGRTNSSGNVGQDNNAILNANNANSSQYDCYNVGDAISSILDIKDVPTFLGGLCECQTGCVKGVPNNQTTPYDLDVEEEILSIKNQVMQAEMKTGDLTSYNSSVCIQRPDFLPPLQSDEDDSIKDLENELKRLESSSEISSDMFYDVCDNT